MSLEPKNTSHTPKVLVVVGPTSSGKSELAVKIAKKFNGEIISCDSRQIYRGMDIGTGKVEGKWKMTPEDKTQSSSVYNFRGRGNYIQAVFVYKNIWHHCIDYVNPKKQYSVAKFKEDAQRAIGDILSRGKLPILCGGTGHWVDAVIYGQTLPEVKPNPDLRAKLEKKSIAELFKQLQKLDPVRAKSIDPKNPRRLIRALEIVITTGHPVPPSRTLNLVPSAYSALWLGISLPQEVLYKKIDKRLLQRLKQGMVKEIETLHRQGLSWKRLTDFGLEYRFVSLYLQKKLGYSEMVNQLSYAIKHYSKRQMTWFKKNKSIHWVHGYEEAKALLITV